MEVNQDPRSSRRPHRAWLATPPRMACHARKEWGLQLASLAVGKETMLAQSHLELPPRSRASIKETASPNLMAACHQLAPYSKAHPNPSPLDNERALTAPKNVHPQWDWMGDGDAWGWKRQSAGRDDRGRVPTSSRVKNSVPTSSRVSWPSGRRPRREFRGSGPSGGDGPMCGS